MSSCVRTTRPFAGSIQNTPRAAAPSPDAINRGFACSTNVTCTARTSPICSGLPSVNVDRAWLASRRNSNAVMGVLMLRLMTMLGGFRLKRALSAAIRLASCRESGVK
jgi:hypothetical protein